MVERRPCAGRSLSSWATCLQLLLLAFVAPVAAVPTQRLHRKAHIRGAALQAAKKTRPPNGPAWFGGFSEGESTYDADADGRDHVREYPQARVLQGWNPQQPDPYTPRVTPAEWFHESPSAAWKEAWQTHYPAVQAGIAGRSADLGMWYKDEAGTIEQAYHPGTVLQTNSIPPAWFDSSVNQIDGYGRHKEPSMGTPRRLWYWQERSVNTTFSCTNPGCTANVSLQAPYNSQTEKAQFCKISVYVHPTDYDEQYSGEEVTWIMVNNHIVRSNCQPLLSGCNISGQSSLVPCVEDLPLDQFLGTTGSITVSAKIPDVVDECPYQGNMLHGVPMVTCMVAPIEGASALAEPVSPEGCVQEVPVQCTARGCTAKSVIRLNPGCASLGQCLLDVTTNQTDYDRNQGSDEQVEYVSVNGSKVQTGIFPGVNPCLDLYHNATPSSTTFALVTGYNVTQVTAEAGKVEIEAKISALVDECASNGYLFDARAKVNCSR